MDEEATDAIDVDVQREESRSGADSFIHSPALLGRISARAERTILFQKDAVTKTYSAI